jgi:phage major head subunit gpT-like protein
MVARVTSDDNAFKVFRGGFTTTLTADGSALFSTHTLIGGGTVVNNGTGALTPDNLYTGIVALRQQKNQAGVVLGNVPSILLVGSALFKKAIEITQSALLADSADNNLNVYRGIYGLKVMSSPWLDANIGSGTTGSDTAWYLLSNNHSVSRLVRQGIQTYLRDYIYSNNRTYNYGASFREEVFCSDYCGSYGSTGTTA